MQMHIVIVLENGNTFSQCREHAVNCTFATINILVSDGTIITIISLCQA